MTQTSRHVGAGFSAGRALEEQFCISHGIPFLSIAPEERLRSILAYRNDRRLFRRKCDATGAPIISCYHPRAPYKVVKSEIWWGDDWDGIDSGFAPNLSQPLFPQFAQLQQRIPREGTSVVNAENCDYNSHTRESKNCYLSHLAFKCEGALYSYWSVSARDIIECSYVAESELCFRCSYITGCYDAVYLEESANCNACLFSYQLRGCNHCILCSNSSNQSYQIRNKAVSKDEFLAFRARLTTDPRFLAQILEEFTQLKIATPYRAQHSLQCQNSSGEHLNSCRDCFYCFDARNAEHCFNASNGGGHNIIHGYSVGFPESSSVFSSVTIRNSSDIFFCVGCWNSNNLWYCDNCVNCRDCFFCAGLKNRQFCLFNQQLTETDYNQQVIKLKQAMVNFQEFGLFFPLIYSPFAYNESAAQDFFPLSDFQIAELEGYYRAALGSNAAHAAEPSPKSSALELPTPGTVASCHQCSSPYRFVEREIELYHQFGVPAPTECPDCRLTTRLAERAPYSLFSRSCNHCQCAVESAEAARPVVCEQCFLATN